MFYTSAQSRLPFLQSLSTHPSFRVDTGVLSSCPQRMSNCGSSGLLSGSWRHTAVWPALASGQDLSLSWQTRSHFCIDSEEHSTWKLRRLVQFPQPIPHLGHTISVPAQAHLHTYANAEPLMMPNPVDYTWMPSTNPPSSSDPKCKHHSAHSCS